MKKLSIIIPYYNGGEYTKKLIECLAPQVTKEVEVILVDDGSKEPFKTTEKWLKVIHKENGGVSAARNAGIDKATGEYITFVDHDDLLPPYYIQKIMEKIAEGFDYMYMSWKTAENSGWKYEVKLNSVDDKFPTFNLCVWNRVYKRDLIGDVRFNTKKIIAEDAEFIRKVHERGKKAFISDFMYYYRTDKPDTLTKLFNEGKTGMRRVVYHFEHVTQDMTYLIEEFKKADEDAEVMLMTHQNDIPELEDYAMVIKPREMKGTELRGEPTPLFSKLPTPIKTQVVIWTEHTYKIGGIETFIYNFCAQMSPYYDILVLYNIIDPEQLARLRQIVECKRYTGQSITCDSIIVNRITDKVPDTVTYKQKIQMVHACKMDERWEVPDGDLIVPVSDAVVKSYGMKDGYKVIHNMTIPRESREPLFLVSATRISTREKGEKRMIDFAKALKGYGVPFIWLIFTDRVMTGAVDGMVFMNMTMNVAPFLAKADYLVQLSDSEAFCYSMVEALELGTPVITTPVDVLDEIGIEDGVNGYIVPFDMNISKKTMQNITERIPDGFAYDNGNPGIVKKWRAVLGNTKPTGAYKPSDEITVKITRKYRDMELERLMMPGEIFQMTRERAYKVIESGFAEEL